MLVTHPVVCSFLTGAPLYSNEDPLSPIPGKKTAGSNSRKESIEVLANVREHVDGLERAALAEEFPQPCPGIRARLYGPRDLSCDHVA